MSLLRWIGEEAEVESQSGDDFIHLFNNYEIDIKKSSLNQI